MKVISKKLKPAIEFGDKVRLLAESNGGDLHKDDIGVVTVEEDSDGEIEVHTQHHWDYVSTANLEVLQKFNGDEVATAGKSAVIELTAKEINSISTVLNQYSEGSLKRLFNELNTEVA